MAEFLKNDVVQFNENHQWIGCIGIVKEVKPSRIMVGVLVPLQGTAYVYCNAKDLEYIGKAVFVAGEEDE